MIINLLLPEKISANKAYANQHWTKRKQQMTITIIGELMDLNTYVDVCRKNRFSGGKVKKQETENVYFQLLENKIKPIKKFPIRIEYNWFTKDKRKDPDNVSFSKKFINDALQLAKVIPNDSRKYIKNFSDDFFVDKDNPRVELTIK